MSRTGTGKRAALLEAAKTLLWERGFEATSPRDILSLSGAGQGSLYHHFPGKLDLAAEALRAMAEEEIAIIDAIFDPKVPPLDRVRAYLTRERQVMKGCRLARLANETAIAEERLRAPVAAYVEHIRLKLVESLAAAKAKAHLPGTVDPEALATTLLAVIEGGYVLARVRWDPAPMGQAVEGALQLLTAITRPG